MEYQDVMKEVSRDFKWYGRVRLPQILEYLNADYTTGEKDLIVSAIFTRYYRKNANFRFKVAHPRLAKCRGLLEQSGEDGHVFLAEIINRICGNARGVVRGVPMIQDPEGALKYIAAAVYNKLEAKGERGVPEEGKMYSVSEVEGFGDRGYGPFFRVSGDQGHDAKAFMYFPEEQ